MIEDRDVGQIVAAFDLHADVNPHRALTLGALVALPRGVDDFAADALAPGHPQEQPAVVVLSDRQVGSGFAAPFQVEHEPAILFAHRPARGLRQERVLGVIEQVVDRLPSDFLPARRGDRR